MKKNLFLLTLATVCNANTYASEETISSQKKTHSELISELSSQSENTTKAESNDQARITLQKVTDDELLDLLKPQLDPNYRYFFESRSGTQQAESINGVIQIHNESHKTMTYFEQVPLIHDQLYQETEVPPLVKKNGSFSKQCFIVTGFLINLSQKK